MTIADGWAGGAWCIALRVAVQEHVILSHSPSLFGHSIFTDYRLQTTYCISTSSKQLSCLQEPTARETIIPHRVELTAVEAQATTTQTITVRTITPMTTEAPTTTMELDRAPTLLLVETLPASRVIYQLVRGM